MQWKSKAEKSPNVFLCWIVGSGMIMLIGVIDVFIGRGCSIHSFKEKQPPNTILSKIVGSGMLLLFARWFRWQGLFKPLQQ